MLGTLLVRNNIDKQIRSYKVLAQSIGYKNENGENIPVENLICENENGNRVIFDKSGLASVSYTLSTPDSITI